ncbi:MAG TPA: SDR family NAD(P)-dependent oxidoreductase [Candidatus Kapabacteria bacterium]|nr:SDR family NAD(P)-dependent oxidoreductase [Candidatus Kapabacteria bacterium]
MNIVITGASKGIGLAIARRFAEDTNVKHSFSLCARNGEELDSTRKALEKEFPKHSFLAQVCDVSDETQVKEFASTCFDAFGATDLLVNNAGFGIFKQVTELSASDFRAVLGTNLRGVFLLTRELLPPMREKKSGTIVTISSLAGKNGFSGGAAYCASKFAVRGFMQCLFLEIRKDNIRCLTVFPGSVETDLQKIIVPAPTITRMLSVSDVAECVWSSVKLPSGATVSELDIRPTNPKG